MNLKTNIAFLFVIITLTTFYLNSNVYEITSKCKQVNCDCEEIENCFYRNFIDINKLTKPKIFIHVSEPDQLMLGVSQLCIESVLVNCSHKYDIILYTNDDIIDMIGDENDDLCNIKNPNMLSGIDLKQWEHYCRLKVLYKYGGVVMSPTFLFSKCPGYKEFNPKKLKICHVNNEGLSVSNKFIIPNSFYMVAAPKNDSHVEIYLKYFKNLCNNQYSADIKHYDKAFEKLNYLDYFSCEAIGTTNMNGDILHVEDLMESNPIKLSYNNYCLFINMDLLIKKRKFGWFMNMTKEDIKETRTFISIYCNMR